VPTPVPPHAPAALIPLGWDDRVEALYRAIEGTTPTTPVDHDRLVPGRVARVERAACIVATATGDVTARADPLPAVGDWVALAVGTDPSATRVAGVASRWSALTRRDPSGAVQVLAADVDLVLVTTPADRASAARVERETAMAWDSGARPVVLLTKHDVAPPDLYAELTARLVGADVVPTSARTGEGLADVAALLRPNRTAVLLGPSGAGKSTLVNALLGEERLATGAVREADQRGRHTTTARQLLVLPGGGVVIDTPGLRSLALAGDGDGVDAAFPDIEAAARSCRFSDCAHGAEPGCGVRAAVEAGELDRARVASFHKLRRELQREALQLDPVARKEQRRRWSVLTRDARDKARRREGL
jgi:ribosome biogenesis GTPase